jgi:hypothetical protein
MRRNGRLNEFWRELQMLRAELDLMEGIGLRCAECGTADEGERGWTMYPDLENELHAFCPECDRREFGDAR